MNWSGLGNWESCEGLLGGAREGRSYIFSVNKKLVNINWIGRFWIIFSKPHRTEN